MSLIKTERFEYSWWQSLLIKVLRCGKVPEHVAFIMDGNRRFAKENGLATVQGHAKGFDKLAETLQWCNDLGIRQVTVYAFSIENYNRPKEEVEGLFSLAREKLERLIRDAEKLAEVGVRINVIGNTSLLPPDIRQMSRQVMELTSSNSRAVLNVAFSYTSRDEMTQAIRKLASGVGRGLLLPEDITPELIERCLYTSLQCGSDPEEGSPFRLRRGRRRRGADQLPDLLIRTSGEVRLSDFMLWQSTFSVTHFTRVLWPDFSLQHLFAAVFYFQSRSRYISDLLQTGVASPQSSSSSCSAEENPDSTSGSVVEGSRLERTERFLRYLETEELGTELPGALPSSGQLQIARSAAAKGQLRRESCRTSPTVSLLPS